MTGDSWASYRAAMPPECFGEPDDDDDEPRDPRGRPIDCTPRGAIVRWYEPVTFTDADGHRETIDAPASRAFYGPVRVAWKAADRFADLMRRRGKAWVSVDDLD
jgi:hypothetical protein